MEIILLKHSPTARLILGLLKIIMHTSLTLYLTTRTSLQNLENRFRCRVIDAQPARSLP